MSEKMIIAYLRVSGKKQISGSGFPRQEEVIRKYCKKNKITISEIYKEQVSGTKGEDNRPEFMRMVNSILSNGLKTIIVESLDRLAREYRIQEQILYYLASKGIDLVSANTGENITQEMKKDPMRKAIIQMQGVFAELDKSILVNRLAKGRRDRRDVKGLKYPCPAPFGETPEEMEVLKYMVHARQDKTCRMTFQQIADHLNAEGTPPKRAKARKWTIGTVYHAYRTAKELGLK